MDALNPRTIDAVERAGARLLDGRPPRTYSEVRRMRAIARELQIPVPEPEGRKALRVFSPATSDWVRFGR